MEISSRDTMYLVILTYNYFNGRIMIFGVVFIFSLLIKPFYAQYTEVNCLQYDTSLFPDIVMGEDGNEDYSVYLDYSI